ncbi:MAG: sugar nucleotide-binding protein [Pirellulaceae bacterium]
MKYSQLPDPPLPLLMTGIAGVAGYNALHYFRELYPGQVIGIRPENNWRLQGEGIVGCDAENVDELKRLFDRYQFRSVLNSAGSCALKSCELDPAMAWRVNVLGGQTLLETIAHTDTRLVHLSIDLVYSGIWQGGHVESDNADPVTVYGKTMSIAENLIMLGHPQSCILRISLPMGVSFNGHAGAIDWIQARFKQRKPATLYYDEVRTPTYVDCMNVVFQRMLAGKRQGLFHAGGKRRLSLYQIAQIVNRVGGYAPEHLMGCYRIEAGPIPPRAGNVTMDSTRLADAIGYDPFDPWPLDAEMTPTHRDWHYERNGFHGSPELLAEVLYRNPACPAPLRIEI